MMVTRILQILDRVLFPRYRRETVRAPLYIIANPRSGTTFLHRMLCADPQFTYLKTHHTLFPAVVAYRLFAVLGAVDRRVGGLLQRFVGWVDRTLFSGLEGVHTVGLDRAEEDELYFMYTMLSPALALLFPFMDRLPYLVRIDSMGEEVRDRMARYYLDCLQRHLFAAGEGRTLLMKNVLAPGRIQIYLQACPDMRIVHLVRHPYEVLGSWASMAARFFAAHSPQIGKDSEETRQFVRLSIDYYRIMMELKRELPSERFIEFRYDALRAAPMETVEQIYGHFGLEMSDGFRASLAAEADRAKGYRSTHSYSLEEFGLTREEVHRELREVFEEYGFQP
jgi:hypothetical protein